MEELVAGTINSIFSGADKEVLVEVVRLIQKQGLNGCRGNWKEFLNSYDRKFGDSLSDPSKRSVDVLVDFLKSFNQTKDLMFIGKLFRYFRDQKAFEKYIKSSMNEESPEQRLVRLTMEHPQYRRHYSFDFYNKGWMIVPLGDMSKAIKPNRVLSIDCEMVLCDDGTEAVVKVCVVDKKLKVKLKMLVNPKKSVADYRTEITDVSAEDLVGVTCSLVDIQGFMKKLLKHGTILVGHSVHNDLRALKIAHARVIDTSYIFKYSGVRPTYTPSLNNLCKASFRFKIVIVKDFSFIMFLMSCHLQLFLKTVLGYEVRQENEPHDCRKDAEAAMNLVLAKLEHGFDDPIKIVKRVPDFSHAMLLHRIPVDVPCQELKKVFPQDFNVEIKADLKIRGHFYSTRAIFKDASEASNVFQRIEGPEKKDSEGRPQKLVSLKLSTGQITSFYVCKMSSSPPEYSKRQRTSSFIGSDEGRTCSSESCKHAKEICRLKQELSAREDEILNLQKILADRTGEH
ncbi:hypothetical protein IEQ34_013384 [Dendrobium chrysotoxum]|uniref:Exonuclease domain-containing protein n=1 Tax=Dendrobium chrysotoxum TaxID=161865 RepID=A0AAV7G8B8_DENCH|nr:hypothetical protein IEQ34_013384 [Dendrobium chrysotoxum]